VIGQVLGLGSKVEFHGFGQPERLAESHVHLQEFGTAEYSAVLDPNEKDVDLTGWATIVNRDLLNQLQKIADELPSRRAAQWLARIEEMRGELEVNINRKIASDALLVSMMTA